MKETGWDFLKTLEMLNGLSEKSQEEIKTYIAVVKSRNQTYIRSTVQAVEEQDYATVDQIVKECKRAQKQIAHLQKNMNEMLYYELGIFNGFYEIVESLKEIKEKKEEHRKKEDILGRKHIKNILTYLYENPYARQGQTAEAVGIKPNQLSELLNYLMDADYVNRYGKNKSTQYVLTWEGQQLCRDKIKVRKNETILEYHYEAELKENDYEKWKNKEHYIPTV